MTRDDRDPPPLTDAQRELFRRRVAELDAEPDNVLTWDEIKARIAPRRRTDHHRPEIRP